MSAPTSETVGIYLSENKRSSGPSVRYVLSMLLQLFLISATFLYAIQTSGSSYDDFIFSCRIGTVIVLISVALVLLCNKGIAKPGAIVMYAFVAFQFGIPMVIAFNPSYTDYVLVNLSPTVLVSCSWFTIVCIQCYAFGSIIASYIGAKKLQAKRKTRPFLDFVLGDERRVANTALVVFVIFGVIAYFPLLNQD